MPPILSSSFWSSLILVGFISTAPVLAAERVEAETDLPTLVQRLRSPTEPLTDRIAAAESLGRIGINSTAAVSSLIDLFLKKSESGELRMAAGSALEKLQAGDQAVPALMVVLKDRKEAFEIRNKAFDGYLKLASNSTAFAADFIRIVQDKSEVPEIREKAGRVLRGFTARYAEDVVNRSRTALEAEDRVTRARDIRDAFEIGGLQIPMEITRALARMEKHKASLRSQKTLARRLFTAPWGWIVWPAMLPCLCAPFWLLLLWQFPLKLWEAGRVLQAVPEFRIKLKTEFRLSLRGYLLLAPFQFHPRVLDAWLNQHWASVERALHARDLVADRNLHIPIPARINQSVVARPAPADFKKAFESERFVMCLCGEPGSGKTSLACQLARWGLSEKPEDRIATHRILPVLIAGEGSLRSGDGFAPLIEAIAPEVRSMCNGAEDLSPELLRHLLSRKRVLVIVDGLSEMADSAAALVRSASEEISPISALIITSRVPECRAGAAPLVVECLPFPADTFPEFLAVILTLRGKRSLLNDRELLETSVRFLDSLGSHCPTAHFARLFAEVLLDRMESSSAPAMPRNIFDLTVAHLDKLNRQVAASEKLPTAFVQRLAEAAAWICVRQELSSSAAERKEILTAVQEEGGTEDQLNYLETKLGLLRAVGGSPARLQFGLGVLAEWLAARNAAGLFGADDQAWRRFLEVVSLKSVKFGRIRNFIAALRDCCLLREEELALPDFVEIELGKLVGLNSANLEWARDQRRIARLTKELSHSDASRRQAAVKALAGLGPRAAQAMPALISILEKAGELLEIRGAVVLALAEISADDSDLIPRLIQLMEDRQAGLQAFVNRALARRGDEAFAALIRVVKDRNARDESRVSAVDAIAAFEGNRTVIPALVQVLRDSEMPDGVRAAAVEALGRIGASAEAAVGDLVAVLQDSKTLCQSVTRALLEITPQSKPAIIDLVEALNPAQAPSSREILVSLRRTLVQTSGQRPGALQSIPSDRIQRVLQDALRDARARRKPAARAAATLAIAMAG